jgi:hypothetical protein
LSESGFFSTKAAPSLRSQQFQVVLKVFFGIKRETLQAAGGEGGMGHAKLP